MYTKSSSTPPLLSLLLIPPLLSVVVIDDDDDDDDDGDKLLYVSQLPFRILSPRIVPECRIHELSLLERIMKDVRQ